MRLTVEQIEDVRHDAIMLLMHHDTLCDMARESAERDAGAAQIAPVPAAPAATPRDQWPIQDHLHDTFGSVGNTRGHWVLKAAWERLDTLKRELSASEATLKAAQVRADHFERRAEALQADCELLSIEKGQLKESLASVQAELAALRSAYYAARDKP